MRFFVTYTVMDGALANPFWHAFLMLSYWPGKGQKIQVTNAWGFEAAPNLDVGYGLRGSTLDISFEQFCKLKANKPLTTQTSHSCKSLALELLRDIGITEEYLDEYLEPIFLHSSHDPATSVSANKNKVTLFRTLEDRQYKLFWTLPPQLLMTNDSKLQSLFYLPFTAEDKVKNTIKILQALEKCVENVIVTETNRESLQRLTDYIYELYDMFAIIKGANLKPKVNKKLAEIERFFADIHSAIIGSLDDNEEPVAVVAKFTESEQRAICRLLDRPFLKWSAAQNARNF